MHLNQLLQVCPRHAKSGQAMLANSGRGSSCAVCPSWCCCS